MNSPFNYNHTHNTFLKSYIKVFEAIFPSFSLFIQILFWCVKCSQFFILFFLLFLQLLNPLSTKLNLFCWSQIKKKRKKTWTMINVDKIADMQYWLQNADLFFYCAVLYCVCCINEKKKTIFFLNFYNYAYIWNMHA